MLATGSSDMHIHLWDLATGRQKQTLTGHTGAVHAIAFHSSNGLPAHRPTAQSAYGTSPAERNV